MAATYLDELTGRGIHVWLEDAQIRFRAVGVVVDLTDLRARKVDMLRELVERMRVDDDLPASVAEWDPDARESYEERAAIMEFDGGLSRLEAELSAEALVRQRRSAGVRP